MVVDIQTVHHISKNTAVQNVNKPFVYITDLTSTLNHKNIYNLIYLISFFITYKMKPCTLTSTVYW
jgi:hypothetical protein